MRSLGSGFALHAPLMRGSTPPLAAWLINRNGFDHARSLVPSGRVFSPTGQLGATQKTRQLSSERRPQAPVVVGQQLELECARLGLEGKVGSTVRCGHIKSVHALTVTFHAAGP